MKKILIAALAASMILLAGCGNTQNTDEGKSVMPNEASISIENLNSAEFPAAFDAFSLKDADGALSLEVEVYDE